MFKELVDIKEDTILKFDYELMSLLLKDNTSKKNIVWGTDNYSKHGIGFQDKDHITVDRITGFYGEIIKPRTKKSKEEKNQRIKDKAEVFTPSWICNNQNNLIDNNWFGRENVFNKEIETSWITNEDKIEFPTNKKWEEYVTLNRMEITCGEAPYLVSRYDTVSGNIIPLKERVGILDRKFRIINENVDSEEEWKYWSKEAIKSVYGYDWQGDNVLLARENILFTYVDNYKYKFNQKPSPEEIKEITEIIVWNIWQMDGINFVIPYSCENSKYTQMTLFGEEVIETECPGCKQNNYHKHNGIYCKIMNWKTNRTNKFIYVMERRRKK